MAISTQRVQQFRTRQRTGKILLTIEVDEVLLVEALIEARLLYRHRPTIAEQLREH